MIKIWQDEAWEDYIYWQKQDKKTLRRINQLLKDIERNGYIITKSETAVWAVLFLRLAWKRKSDWRMEYDSDNEYQ